MAKTSWGIAAALLCWLLASMVRADAGVHSYALVIGSNRGGQGQGELSFASRDADRMAGLLRELGRTPPDHIVRLSEPGVAAVEGALEKLRERLAAHAATGERAQLVFYYSGHARANALSLGAEELPLSRLRASLMALPSTLTVVVLDACQSGAFSGVKGAAPAADFSIQSVQDLNSSGIAVMASSTGSELSQESRELESSYFTHHLLVSLRGAGDRDRNGRVSLDEAYAYAYQHTLSDTARTQVGSQHATLETALTGRGDVPLSYPVDADAQLALSGAIEGRVLVQQLGRGAVMAELVKASGAPLLIALPSGSYEVLLRGEKSARSCEVTLTRGAVHSLDPARCKEVALPEQRAKSEDLAREQDRLAIESWFVEVGAGVTISREDAYQRRLRAFGYKRYQLGGLDLDMSVGWTFRPRWALVAHYGVMDRQAYERWRSFNDISHVDWRTHSITLGVRWRQPLAKRWLVGFVEADAGLAFTYNRFRTPSPIEGARGEDVYGDRHYGPALRGLLGIDVAFMRHYGMYLGFGYAWSRALENELGDAHQGGGFTIVHGLRLNGVQGGW